MAFGVGMGASLIGGAIQAFGAYQAGIMKQRMYLAEADVAGKLATAETQAAATTGAAGFRASEQTGLQTGASIARQTVEAGAGDINIGTGSTAAVKASQTALGQSAEAETFQKYREDQYQEDLTAAEQTAAAGRYRAAAAFAPIEGEITAAGDIASTVGTTAPVAQKWYDTGGSTQLASVGTGITSILGG